MFSSRTCFSTDSRHTKEKPMRATNRKSLATTAILFIAFTLAAANAADPELAPLPLKLPLPTLKGTPEDLPKGSNIEPLTDKAPPLFLAPKGVKNIALGKKITSSDKSPITGELSQITDGEKEAVNDQVVEMRKGVQWV